MVRFIHSGDLHLGKRFGNLPEDLRGRLREARHGAIERLAELARAEGAATILLAGDTFDTETPAPEVRRQALAAMAHQAPIRWVLLPGNHDSLQASQLWSALATDCPENVELAVEARPLELVPGVVLLPAPCTTRRPGRDLTAWMDGAGTADGTIRIGLGHGPIQNFSEDAAAGDVIAPDRAMRAGLDYLALGDWHGTMMVNARTHYSGSPEPDRFKHETPGQALVVEVAGAGATPEVKAAPTAAFAWRDLPLHLMSEDDGAAMLPTLLPNGPARRQSLVRVVATGRTRVGGRTQLEAAMAALAPEFALLELEESGLVTDCESDDLDLIDRAGALRAAAEALLAESADMSLDAEARATAREALVRLFTYSQATAP